MLMQGLPIMQASGRCTAHRYCSLFLFHSQRYVYMSCCLLLPYTRSYSYTHMTNMTQGGLTAGFMLPCEPWPKRVHLLPTYQQERTHTTTQRTAPRDLAQKSHSVLAASVTVRSRVWHTMIWVGRSQQRQHSSSHASSGRPAHIPYQVSTYK